MRIGALAASASLAAALIVLPGEAVAHAIGGKDAAFVKAAQGADPLPFLYLGAKHMVTGYDHLLFLTGVIFFLYRMKDVLTYVTLFSLGHSTTLLFGVLANVQANPALVDAVIGFSVAYKAFENLGGFQHVGFMPDRRGAVAAFGLVHGFGLATKLQTLGLNRDGLLANLASFNVGVEVGQVLALSLILVLITAWRATPSFTRLAVGANAALFTAGVVLTGSQLANFAITGGQ